MEGFKSAIKLLIFVVCHGYCIYAQCDIKRAESCITDMQDQFNTVVKDITTATDPRQLERLCLNTIKGNNVTQCYIEATGSCKNEEQGLMAAATKWEKIMRDIYELCEGECPGFLDRTLNITQCTSMIRFDALYNQSFQSFCSSLNSSLSCAWGIAGDCPMFERLFFDLLPQGLGGTANTVCSSGCRNLDDALSALDICRQILATAQTVQDNKTEACRAYSEFKTCLRNTELPATCPLVESLMEILYPQHIYSAYEEQCGPSTTTPDTTDDCFFSGSAEFENCVTLLKESMDNIVDEKSVKKDQCIIYGNAIKCLDAAGVDTCEPLNRLYLDLISTHNKRLNYLSTYCSKVLQDKQHAVQSDEDNGGQSSMLSVRLWTVFGFSILITQWTWT